MAIGQVNNFSPRISSDRLGSPRIEIFAETKNILIARKGSERFGIAEKTEVTASTEFGTWKPHPPPLSRVSQCHTALVPLIFFEVSGCHKTVTRVSQAVTRELMEGELIVDGQKSFKVATPKGAGAVTPLQPL